MYPKEYPNKCVPKSVSVGMIYTHAEAEAERERENDVLNLQDLDEDQS